VKEILKKNVSKKFVLLYNLIKDFKETDEDMKSQLNPVDMVHLDAVGEPELIAVELPEDFSQMDTGDQIEYIADQLRALEAHHPVQKGELVRQTSLVKIEKGRLIYSISYTQVMDSEY
jgi:hypothetical protein